MDPLESILLGRPDKHTYVSSILSKEEKEQLRQVLLGNIDVFTWTHSNMIGISPKHASHKPNVVSSTRPVRQRVRRFHQNHHQVIQAKVDNLLDAGFIREIEYPEWLANVVVVPKKGGKWRVCVDYTVLNDAFPKENFPLPPHRPDCRCVSWAWDVVVPRCLLGIPSNPHVPARRRENILHHSTQTLLL